MTPFIKAINELKQAIANIGGKEYSRSDQGLAHYQTFPSILYTHNALQAAWNIADTLSGATAAGSPMIYLLSHRAKMETWSNHFQKEKWILQIDDNTFKLGLALSEFYSKVITDSQAQSILTPFGIDSMKKVQVELNRRLQPYEAESVRKFTTEMDAFVSNFSLPVLPDFIIDSNPLSYQINSSEASEASYTKLIEGLTALKRQLSEQETKMSRERDNIGRTHPIPSGNHPHYTILRSIRDKASEQLIEKIKHLHRQTEQVNDLLLDAKSKLKSITRELGSRMDTDRREGLEEGRDKEKAAKTKAQASFQVFKAERVRYLKMPETDTATLIRLKESASNRRILLASIKDTLTKLKARLSAREVIKESESYEGVLYDESTPEGLKRGLRELLEGARLLAKTPTTSDKFRKALRLPPDSSNPITRLITSVNKRLEEIEKELEIDITQPARVSPSTMSPVSASLINLREQYQRELQLKIDKDRQNTKLVLAELPSRQDHLEHLQIQLNLWITHLDFGIGDMQRIKTSLTGLLETNKEKTPDEVLQAIADSQDSIQQLQAWFESNPHGESVSYNALRANAGTAVTSQEKLLKAIETLYSKVTTTISDDNIVLQKSALLSEYDAIKTRWTATNQHFRELEDLVNALLQKKEAAQLEKLKAIAGSNQIILDLIATAVTLPLHDNEQLVMRIKSQLDSLTNSAAFFATLDPITNYEIIQTYNQILSHQAQLSTFKDALQTSAHQLRCLSLQAIFFGSSSSKIDGVFGLYLQERSKTFWLRDLFEQYASFIFGCKSAAQERTHYLSELKGKLLEYQTKPDTYQELSDMVEKGKRIFSPRAQLGRAEYQYSLLAKLDRFKEKLADLHQQDTDLDQQADNSPSP